MCIQKILKIICEKLYKILAATTSYDGTVSYGKQLQHLRLLMALSFTVTSRCYNNEYYYKYMYKYEK
uniref:Uncharacterized protein n=1 Tax=Glossina palpalis gambiensis TaxID=67801 RepID=A0A1B0AZP0_9MUSC